MSTLQKSFIEPLNEKFFTWKLPNQFIHIFLRAGLNNFAPAGAWIYHSALDLEFSK
jgi:hypothetical protein